MTTIHIHEDDWGMRSLHPVAAWVEAVADLGIAIEAGQRNRAPDGIGWTDVHVIQEPQHNFSSTGVSLDELSGKLGPIMPRVSRFVATALAGFDVARPDPYGSYEDDAWCFGFDAHCFIKLEPRNGLVERIWFEARTADIDRLAALRQAIQAIDRVVESLIIDYWVDVAGRVRDDEFMSAYFDRLAHAAA